MKLKTSPPRIAPSGSCQVVPGRELIRNVIFHPLFLIAERIKIPLDIEGKKKKRRHEFVDIDPRDLAQKPPAGLSPETFRRNTRARLVRVVKRGKGPHLVVGNKAGLSLAWRWDQDVLIDPIRSAGSLFDDQLSTVQDVVDDILTPSPWAPAAYLDEWRIRFLLTLEGHLPYPYILIADRRQHQAFSEFVDKVTLGRVSQTNGAQACPNPKSCAEPHQCLDGTSCPANGAAPVDANERRIHILPFAFPDTPLEVVLDCLRINPRTYSEARKRILTNSSATCSEASS